MVVDVPRCFWDSDGVEMTDTDRAQVAKQMQATLAREFGGNKKAAYTHAGVNPATFDRMLAGEVVKTHSLTAAVGRLWPETEGDWRRLLTGPVSAPGLDELSDADLMRVLLRRAELREAGGSDGDTTPSTRAGSAGARKGVRARTNRQGPHLREVDASSKVKDTSGQGNESP